MGQFSILDEGIDVSAALTQIDGQPELWNTYANRILPVNSPHRETSDIWVRYRMATEINRPGHFDEPHESVWYPAWYALPALRPIVFRLAEAAEATRIGGILMTRIPPGGQVYPHHDKRTWHSEYYDTKIWMPLRGNERCINWCEDEDIVMKPGTAYTFSNLKVHSVENNGDTERIVLIVCTKR